MKKALFLSLCILVFVGCRQQTPTEQILIVEGWIEENEPPIVFLHYPFTFDEDITSTSELFEQKLIIWGKVTIDDGASSVVLTGKLDTTYLPPYKYSTARLLGEVGKTYEITVEYDGKTATAKSKLLPPVPIDSIVVAINENDRAYIDLYFTAPSPSDDDGYVIFCKHQGTYQYLASILGVFDNSKAIDGQFKVQVYRPLALLASQDLAFNFSRGDTIDIKLAHIDRESYNFWNAFTAQNAASRLPFVPIYGNVPTNINNGKGYWSAMNSSKAHLILNRDTVVRYTR